MTCIELSRKLGLSESTIGIYERGKSNPSLSNLCKIADYFGVSIDWLVGRTNQQSDNQKIMNALSKIYQSVKRIEEKDGKPN